MRGIVIAAVFSAMLWCLAVALYHGLVLLAFVELFCMAACGVLAYEYMNEPEEGEE